MTTTIATAAAVIIGYEFYACFFTYIFLICPINLERDLLYKLVSKEREIYLAQITGIEKLLVVCLISSLVVFLPHH